MYWARASQLGRGQQIGHGLCGFAVRPGLGQEHAGLAGGRQARLVRKHRRIGRVQAHAIEALQVALGPGRVLVEVGVEALQEQRPNARLRLARPEAAHLGFLEQVVAAKHLVSALPRQDHLVALFTHQTGQGLHGRGCRPQDGRFGVPDGGLELVTDGFR